MSPSQFTSLYEVFSAFNFAYIISDKYNVYLKENIVRSFQDLNSNISSIDKKIEVSKKSLYNCSVIQELAKSKPKTEEYTKSLKVLEDRFISIKETVLNRLERVGLTYHFVYLCLYNSLFCLTTLFIIGFISSEDTRNDKILQGVLFIFNLLSLAFNAVAILSGDAKERNRAKKEKSNIKKEKYRFNLGYGSTLYYYLICGTVISVYYVYKHHVNGKILLFDDIELINVFLSVFIPICHFIYYLIKAQINSIRYSYPLFTEVGKFEEEFDALEIKISRHVSFHSEYDEYK